jgi:hypothetical protein
MYKDSFFAAKLARATSRQVRRFDEPARPLCALVAFVVKQIPLDSASMKCDILLPSFANSELLNFSI